MNLATPSFDGRRAVIHALVAIGASMLLGAALAGAGLYGKPDEAANELGKSLIWLGGFAFLASYAAQRKKRILFYGAALMVVLLGVGGPILLAVPSMLSRESRLTPEERAAFSRKNGRLCNTALQAGIADPGERFAVDPQLQLKLNQRLQNGSGNLAGWAWTAPGLGAVLLTVSKCDTGSPRSFQEFARGMKAGVLEGHSVEVETEEISVRASPYTYRLTSSRADGLVMDLSCAARASDRRFAPALCVTTVAANHAALLEVRNSIRFEACQ